MEPFYPELEYDCLCCGKGCRMGWSIPVEPAKLAAIEVSRAAEDARGGGFLPLDVLPDGSAFLGQTGQGHCVFLREDNLCAVHAEAGYRAKPLQCRQFPFLPVNTPGGVYLGLSFLCTAVQRRHGRPVRDHAEGVVELVRALSEKLGQQAPAEVALPVLAGQLVNWQGYVELEDFVRSRLEEPSLEAGLHRVAVSFSRFSGSLGIDLVPWDTDVEAVDDLVQLFLATFVGLVETDVPEERQGLTQAVLSGQPYYSRRLEATVDSSRVHARLVMLAHPSWLQEEYRRYLSHLVFRKFLIQGPCVQARACLLLVVSRLLDFYLVLSTIRAGRDFPEREDLWSAFDVVEGDVVSHATGMERLIGALGEAFQQIVKPT